MKLILPPKEVAAVHKRFNYVLSVNNVALVVTNR